MTDNTPTTKQEEGGLGALEGAMQYGKERLFKWRHKDPASVPKELRCICELIHAVERLSARATPPHNEDGLRKALEQSPTDEAFADAVWAALKGDHNDLRRQAIILRAHRAANAARQALGDIPSG